MDTFIHSPHIFNYIALISAGLGFFFLGMEICTKYLKQLFTLRMQEKLLQWTQSDILSSVWGFIFGMITSESTIVTFLTANLSSSQGLNTRKALPIINWNNPGGCLIIFVLFIPIKELVMFSIGILGLLLLFERFSRFHSLIGFLLGIAIFLFGIFAISSGSMYLLQKPEIKDAIISYVGNSYLIIFIAGALIAFVAQSFIAFVISMNFAHTGIFTLDQIFILLCGAHVGLALCTWLLFSAFKGVSKQIVLAEVLFLVCVATIFTPLVNLERTSDIPIMSAFVGFFTKDPSLQVAIFILTINIVTAFILSFLMDEETQFLEHLSPHQLGEDLAAPQFLNPYFLKSPALATQLIPKEFAVLSIHLLRYFEIMKSEISPANATLLEKTHTSFQSIFVKLHSYMIEFITQSDNKFISNKLLYSMEILDNLTRLEENLYQKAMYLQILYENKEADEKSKHIIDSLVDAEEAIFFTFVDTMKEADDESLKWLIQILQEKDGSVNKESIIFSRVPYDYIQSIPTLIYLASLFERDAILINNICIILLKIRPPANNK